jgi:alkylhydroperoxidase family enzyme
MARIKLPDGGGTEIDRMWTLLRPEMAEAVVHFNSTISNGKLDPRVYEMVRFRIAQINDCPN